MLRGACKKVHGRAERTETRGRAVGSERAARSLRPAGAQRAKVCFHHLLSRTSSLARASSSTQICGEPSHISRAYG